MEFQTSSTNSALKSLDVLIGDWTTEIWSFQGDPSARIRGQASFQWLEGGAFILQRAQVLNSDFPSVTAVIGPDDSAGTYGMLYFDSRGISRIYQMSLNESGMKLWRDFPGFSQRFIAMFSEDHIILTGSWEASSDGTNWEHDFSIKYTKINKP